MRRIVLSLAASVAFAVVAGCSNSNSPQEQQAGQQGQPAPASTATSVSGTVSLREARQLSPQATLEIKLLDVSTQSPTPLATKMVAPVTQMPVQFTLDFSPTDINPADLYVVQANLIDGERHFAMPLQAPVLTKGAPAHVDIKLVAEATPEEKMLAEFTKVQKRIGGMAMSKGTALSKDVSRGWQVFRDKDSGEILFVRELADYGDKGFTSTDYAYHDGKPWVVVQQKKPSQSAKPSEIDRAGWSDAGDLVLKQKVSGGDTTPLAADVAADLRTHAQAMYAQVAKKSPKKKRR
jgi:putative lipoprotein